MSHISLIKISIKNVNRQLLMEAVKNLAKELNAEVTDEIQDYYGNKQRVDIAIKSNIFHRGVAFTIAPEGNVELKGDFYKIPSIEIEKLQKSFQKHYLSQALRLSLKQMGYKIQTKEVKEKIYITAW